MEMERKGRMDGEEGIGGGGYCRGGGIRWGRGGNWGGEGKVGWGGVYVVIVKRRRLGGKRGCMIKR